jgi:hypothetical protein
MQCIANKCRVVCFPVTELIKLPLIVPNGINSVIVATTAIFQSRVSWLSFAAMIVIMLSADACLCAFYSNGRAVYG